MNVNNTNNTNNNNTEIKKEEKKEIITEKKEYEAPKRYHRRYRENKSSTYTGK